MTAINSDAEIVRLQQRLRDEGHYTGRLDGIFGPLTLSAQIHTHGAPAYMLVAAGELGVSEILGARDNPRIRAYHAATTLGEQPDEVPWCSSFACWVIMRGGGRSTRSAAARSWLGWGAEPWSALPSVGAVAVLSRGRAPSGHVGFVVHWDARRLWLLGGNQGDRVSIQAFQKARLLGLRVAP